MFIGLLVAKITTRSSKFNSSNHFCNDYVSNLFQRIQITAPSQRARHDQIFKCNHLKSREKGGCLYISAKIIFPFNRYNQIYLINFRGVIYSPFVWTIQKEKFQFSWLFNMSQSSKARKHWVINIWVTIQCVSEDGKISVNSR